MIRTAGLGILCRAPRAEVFEFPAGGVPHGHVTFHPQVALMASRKRVGRVSTLMRRGAVAALRAAPFRVPLGLCASPPRVRQVSDGLLACARATARSLLACSASRASACRFETLHMRSSQVSGARTTPPYDK